MTFEESFRWYLERYDLVHHHVLKPGKREMLGDLDHRVCRFCGKAKPDVTFKKVAHAVPESLGNKSLVSAYECDVCNEFFGGGIESHLGNWSKPMRTMARITGKSGVPTLKKGGDNSWRIEYDRQNGFKMASYEDDPIFEYDEAKQQLTLKLRREAHIPLAVLKAFWKIGYTLLPDDELPNFEHVLRWIMDANHARIGSGPSEILYTFQPGPMPPEPVGVALLLRKEDVTGFPYAFLVIRYGNETFQVPMPSAVQDGNGTSSPLPYFQFPDLVDPARFGQAKRWKIDLSSPDVARSDLDLVVHAELVP